MKGRFVIAFVRLEREISYEIRILRREIEI